MIFNSGSCISSINPNVVLILNILNASSCMMLRRKVEVVRPEVIPLHINSTCVNGSDVSNTEVKLARCFWAIIIIFKLCCIFFANVYCSVIHGFKTEKQQFSWCHIYKWLWPKTITRVMWNRDFQIWPYENITFHNFVVKTLNTFTIIYCFSRWNSWPAFQGIRIVPTSDSCSPNRTQLTVRKERDVKPQILRKI